jgi:hypothetical protein
MTRIICAELVLTLVALLMFAFTIKNDSYVDLKISKKEIKFKKRPKGFTNRKAKTKKASPSKRKGF